jgi:tRNA A-37 threonylcarbamoyl transferase component Bud32
MGETADEAPVALLASRYRLREILGRGGMGTVWRATDEVLGRDVAVKRVRLDGLAPAEAAVARERTMREARIAAALHHPNVVSIFDVVVEEDEPWLVLEYLPSRSLGSVLTECHTLPPAEVAAIGVQVAAALAAAHAAGIVHRDVKPENILIARPPAVLPGTGAPLVKLTDFGIAHAATAPAITATHVLTGTPAYFAPETARGDGTDPRTDVYSLGATLYAAVEGSPPFGDDHANLLGLLSRIARGGAPPPRRAGPLTGLLRSLMSDDPGARPTAARAAEELLRLSPGAATAEAEAPTVEFHGHRPHAPRRHRPIVTVLGVLAVAAVAITIAVVAPGGDGAAQRTGALPSSAGAIAGMPAQVRIDDPLTADPCSLMANDSLAAFGSTTLDPDNAPFAGCRVDISGPEGAASVDALFETEAEDYPVAGSTRALVGQLSVVRFPPRNGACDRRILLSDGHAVRLSARDRLSGSFLGDLCAVAEAATIAAVDRLAAQGIGERPRLDVETHLGGTDACTLLTPADVAFVPGMYLRMRRFGGWGCEWTTNADPRTLVQVFFFRRWPLTDAHGAPADFGGRPGRVQPGEGYCRVQFAQRTYWAGATGRIESVWVDVHGPQPDAERCGLATTLAGAVAAKLPPPA